MASSIPSPLGPSSPRAPRAPKPWSTQKPPQSPELPEPLSIEAPPSPQSAEEGYQKDLVPTRIWTADPWVMRPVW